MIFALLNIASDITLNVAWWTTKTVIGGVYSLLEKGWTKNNSNILEKSKEEIDKDEKITILMNKIDVLLENNLLEKGCTKINN